MDNHQNPLQADVLSFFTPATENSSSMHYHTPVPKFDIFESAASKSKTITVKCEVKPDHLLTTPETNTTQSHADSNGCYRLERLDSSINPDITAKLDRMAQKLGFQVSTNNDLSDHNATSDYDDLQLDDCDLGDIHAPTTHANSKDTTVSVTQTTADAGPKRSLFSNLMKRFSSRPKTAATHTRDVGSAESSRTRAASADTRPRRIRRWFTKRLWRQKASEPKEEHSEASMASAGAMLEDVFASTDGLDTSPPGNHFSQHPSTTSHKFPVLPSTHSGPSRDFVSLEHLSSFAISPHDTRLPEALTVQGYPAEPPTSDLYTSGLPSRFQFPPRSAAIASGITDKSLTLPFLQNYESTPSPPLTSVSFHQSCSKPRGRSAQSTSGTRSGNDAHRSTGQGSFLSRHACGSEGNALHQRSAVAPVLAESKLPYSYTPSYVGVSVAAFGYSGYGRTSYSANSLHTSKLDRPRDLTLSNGPTINSSIHGGTGPTKPTVNARGSSPIDRPKKSPLHVEIAESINSTSALHHSPIVNGDARESSANSIQQGRKQTEAKQGDSSRTPSRPTSKLSQSPCPSPSADVSESNSGVLRMRRTRTRSQTGNSDDQEHWHRSSLIMIAVAHASPRGRPTTAGVGDAHEDAPLDIGLHSSGSVRLVNGNHEKRDHFSAGDGICTPLTQSYHEPIREEPSEEPKHLVPTVPSPVAPGLTAEQKPTDSETVVDGKYFLRIADQIQAELVVQIDRTEADLQSVTLDEECAGLLRTAVGKAKLLLSEKFAQFRSLCQQNLDWEAAQQAGTDEHAANSDRPDLVTLVSDLDGFWAMVMLQVDDVRALFAQVDRLRANGWTPVPIDEQPKTRMNMNGDKPVAGDGDGVAQLQSAKKLATTKRKVTSGSKPVGPTRDDTAARAKARERLAAAKRELRAKKMEAIANMQAGQATSGSGVSEDAFVMV